MSQTQSRMLEPMADFASAEASLSFGQLEDLTRRLWTTVESADTSELSWQLARGTNTIGMLLAHLAISEVFWVSELTERAFLCEQVLDIGPDDDGMPLHEGAPAPQNLTGKALPYYRDLLLRAREHTRQALGPLQDADLVRTLERRGRREVHLLNGRWILYHLVEHLGGHSGQIALLRHLYRIRPGA